MNYGIAFSPLIPTYVLWGALAVGLVLAMLLLLARSRGAVVRIGALALFLLALANPSFTREDREPLSSVVVVVVDKSPSQEFGDRTQQTENARAELAAQGAALLLYSFDLGRRAFDLHLSPLTNSCWAASRGRSPRFSRTSKAPAS